MLNTLTPELFTSLKNYNVRTFKDDLMAGITVGIVALPLAMAFALAAGFSPTEGLVTAIIAGGLMACTTGSKVQIGGPTGAFIIIIVGVVAKFGISGLLISTMLAGLFMILFGLFKMGGLIRFIPFPVITGFTSGIALTIFSTQMKDLLGLPLAGSEIPAAFIAKWGCYFQNIGTTNLAALGISLLTVIAIILTRKFAPKLPAMLIGMLAATIVAQLAGLNIETIGARYPDLPTSLPSPGLPHGFDWSRLPELVSPAFTIALLAAIESLLSATVADGMIGKRHKPNTELISQGIGNIGSAFFGGLPATGAIARTATNVKAGGKTPVSGIIHALTIFGVLLLFGSYIKMIPFAALGGVLVIVCYNMSEIPAFARIVRGPRTDVIVLLITFILTVLVDLTVAVEVGVVLAALFFIGRMSRLSEVNKITGDITGDGTDAGPRPIEERYVPEGVEVFEVQGPFFFGAVSQFKELILRGIDEDKIDVVILRMRQVPILDATGLNVLRGLLEHCKRKNIRLMMSGVQPQTLALFRHSGFMAEIHKINLCIDIDAALARARRYLDRKHEHEAHVHAHEHAHEHLEEHAHELTPHDDDVHSSHSQKKR